MKLSEKNKDFFLNVYDVVRRIPEGKVTSYGAIAKYLGSPRSSRMVGWAMNAAHSLPDIPAHRVVNRNGMLTGKMHFETNSRMEELLSKEGIKVNNDQIENFKLYYWDPSLELQL
ncbi:MAG: MGMT family protein [Crocinitomicaceae bacterium]|nr:MGMT family protein [Crocinitomicaceae bacterium]